MIRIFYLFFVFLFFGCTSFYSSDFQPPIYVKYVREIIATHARETKKSQGLNLEAQGGEFMGEVKVFRLFYYSDRCVTIDEARRIYVNITESFLDRLNAHEEIRPYLQNYPANLNNIRILIHFADCKKGSNEVEIVHLNEHIVEYMQDIEPFKRKVIYEEPYEKALKIVREEKLQLK